MQAACLLHIYLLISLREFINPSAWHNPTNEIVPNVTVAHQQKPVCHLFFQRLNKIILLSSSSSAEYRQNSSVFFLLFIFFNHAVFSHPYCLTCLLFCRACLKPEEPLWGEHGMVVTGRLQWHWDWASGLLGNYCCQWLLELLNKEWHSLTENVVVLVFGVKWGRGFFFLK